MPAIRRREKIPIAKAVDGKAGEIDSQKSVTAVVIERVRRLNLMLAVALGMRNDALYSTEETRESHEGVNII